jgi:hypothetical protein
VGGSHKREGADVVVMGVRDEDGFEILGNLVEEWSGVPAVLARVHSGIEEDRVFACTEEIGVGADFRGTRQVGESDHEKKVGRRKR